MAQAVTTAKAALETAVKDGRTRLASKIERDLAKLQTALQN